MKDGGMEGKDVYNMHACMGWRSLGALRVGIDTVMKKNRSDVEFGCWCSGGTSVFIPAVRARSIDTSLQYASSTHPLPPNSPLRFHPWTL